VAVERPTRQGLGRRLIGWIAAYALVLHAVFAGMVVAQLAGGAPAPGFEICVDHPDGAGAPGQTQHQHDQCALHCAAVAGLAPLLVALVALAFPLRPIAYRSRRRAKLALAFLPRAGLSRAPPLTA
jgi:amino acid transporter